MDGVKFAGGSWFEMDGVEAYSANITSDRQTGIGKWSDRELIKAIREGRRPDGSTIGPPMPLEHYRYLSDRDVWAVVTYLRTVRPVSNGVPRSTYRDPLPPYFGPPITNVPEVPRANRLAYGAYLAGPAGRCIECHTPMSSLGGRDFANRLGAGGSRFEGAWGTVVSSNLTPDRETGIGQWSDGEIKTAIRKGVRPDGTRLKGPMPISHYATITDEDVDAIVAYLRSLPPLKTEAR